MLMINTGSEGALCLICLSASSPLRPGMLRSHITTSQEPCMALFIRLSASPTSSMVADGYSSINNWRRPLRTIAWSSAINTRSIRHWLKLYSFVTNGHRYNYFSAFTAYTMEFVDSTHHCHSFFHSKNSQRATFTYRNLSNP